MKRRNFLSWVGAMLVAPFVPVVKAIPADPLEEMEKYWRRDGGVVKFHITPDRVGVDGRAMRMTYGTIEVSAQAVAQGRSADFYRGRILWLPKPGEWRESQGFRLSEDGRCLTFRFVDSSQGFTQELIRIADSLRGESLVSIPRIMGGQS